MGDPKVTMVFNTNVFLNDWKFWGYPRSRKPDTLSRAKQQKCQIFRHRRSGVAGLGVLRKICGRLMLTLLKFVHVYWIISTSHLDVEMPLLHQENPQGPGVSLN